MDCNYDHLESVPNECEPVCPYVKDNHYDSSDVGDLDPKAKEKGCFQGDDDDGGHAPQDWAPAHCGSSDDDVHDVTCRCASHGGDGGAGSRMDCPRDMTILTLGAPEQNGLMQRLLYLPFQDRYAQDQLNGSVTLKTIFFPVFFLSPGCLFPPSNDRIITQFLFFSFGQQSYIHNP